MTSSLKATKKVEGELKWTLWELLELAGIEQLPPSVGGVYLSSSAPTGNYATHVDRDVLTLKIAYTYDTNPTEDMEPRDRTF